MICKFCVIFTKSDPKPNNRKDTRCIVCNKTKQQYSDSGQLDEFNNMIFLRTVWLKCKNFNQESTGSKSLDILIIDLWGKPHASFNSGERQRYTLRCGKGLQSSPDSGLEQMADVSHDRDRSDLEGKEVQVT